MMALAGFYSPARRKLEVAGGFVLTDAVNGGATGPVALSGGAPDGFVLDKGFRRAAETGTRGARATL